MKKILLSLVCVCLLFVGYKQFKKSPQKTPQNYTPKTWSAFQEYPRLEMLIKGFAIQSMIDVPAVDIAEFRERKLPLTTYIGACADRDGTLSMQARFGSEKRSFHTLDPTIDLLPKVDLIFAWDYLTTLKRSEVKSTLLHFKKSGAKFLLMTHDPNGTKNKKNKTGLPQAINWKLPPYFFPEPMITFDNFALWSLDQL